MSVQDQILSDINAIFSDGLTVDCIHDDGVTQTTIKVFFDQPFVELFGETVIESATPSILCKTDDLAQLNLTRSSIFIIDGTSYSINEIENDQNGVTRIHLSEVS